MKTSNAVIASLLALTQSVWMVKDAHAQHDRQKKAMSNAKDKARMNGQGALSLPEDVRSTTLAASRSVGIFKSSIGLRPMTFMAVLKIAAFVHLALPRKTMAVCPPGKRAHGEKAIPWHAVSCFMTCQARWC